MKFVGFAISAVLGFQEQEFDGYDNSFSVTVYCPSETTCDDQIGFHTYSCHNGDPLFINSDHILLGYYQFSRVSWLCQNHEKLFAIANDSDYMDISLEFKAKSPHFKVKCCAAYPIYEEPIEIIGATNEDVGETNTMEPLVYYSGVPRLASKIAASWSEARWFSPKFLKTLLFLQLARTLLLSLVQLQQLKVLAMFISLGFLENSNASPGSNSAREDFTLLDEVSSDAAAENTFYVLLLSVLEGVKDNSGLACKGLLKMSSNSALRVEFFQSCQRKEILKCHWPLSNVKYTLSPIKEFGQNFLFAPIGLLDMYNSGGAVDTMNWITELSECIIKIKGKGCGRFGAYSNIKPKRFMLDMKEEEFHPPTMLRMDY
ncbi:hypothetical protein LWI29_031294 [Acer saccharum]|uniref:Uncharacterized protein n=1 Tax=Acer saccharum TaxID=4024 RepID=A0AA39T4U2_ACESA|nr:hypothetical protein LWI29_031294 [Acer saccharum]